MENNIFKTLNGINVNNLTEKKNGLTYLSWAHAWGEVKKHYPKAFYTVYENVDGWCYHSDSKTAWVKTGITIEELEHIEYLPVMDYRNKSIPCDKITSFDINKAIQRSLTKACARHGLGLYIYEKEDLPENIADKVATSFNGKEINPLKWIEGKKDICKIIRAKTKKLTATDVIKLVVSNDYDEEKIKAELAEIE